MYEGNSNIELASTGITVGDKRVKVTGAIFENNIPTISGTAGIKLERVLKKSGVKTDDGNPVTFKLLDDRCVNIIGVDETIIGNLKINTVDGDITPSFNDDSGNLKIVVDGENESGKIRLTVNKLNGRTSAADDIPPNETMIAHVTITCEDL